MSVQGFAGEVDSPVEGEVDIIAYDDDIADAAADFTIGNHEVGHVEESTALVGWGHGATVRPIDGPIMDTQLSLLHMDRDSSDVDDVGREDAGTGLPAAAGEARQASELVQDTANYTTYEEGKEIAADIDIVMAGNHVAEPEAEFAQTALEEAATAGPNIASTKLFADACTTEGGTRLRGPVEQLGHKAVLDVGALGWGVDTTDFSCDISMTEGEARLFHLVEELDHSSADVDADRENSRTALPSCVATAWGDSDEQGSLGAGNFLQEAGEADGEMRVHVSRVDGESATRVDGQTRPQDDFDEDNNDDDDDEVLAEVVAAEVLADEVAAMEYRVAAMETTIANSTAMPIHAPPVVETVPEQHKVGAPLVGYDSDDEMIGESSPGIASVEQALLVPEAATGSPGVLSAFGGYASDSDPEGGKDELPKDESKIEADAESKLEDKAEAKEAGKDEEDGVAEESKCETDDDSDRTLPSDDDAPDPACAGGLLVGMQVRIENLRGAVHLNGQVATLENFDSGSLRWHVRLSSMEIKALRPENLVSIDADAQGSGENREDDDGTAEGDEYASLDANEVAATAMQAELDGNDELAATLNAVLAVRLAKMIEDGTAPVEARIEVPREHVGRIIGRGGERIKRIAEESGARMTFVREDDEDDELPGVMRILVVKGVKTAVEQAQALVEETLAAAVAGKGKGKGHGKKGKRRGVTNRSSGEDLQGGASGMAGFEQGVCKWFAAGFCRNRASRGACRNGCHDTAAALQAEAVWVQSAPAGKQKPAVKPILLILDFEGGGQHSGRDGEDEIIEVPVLAMCSETGRELGRFHRFSRPGFWDRERESMQRRYPPECFNDGSSAVPFPQVLADLRSWICQLLELPSGDQLTSDHFLFLTCGNWDVKTVMPRQCNNPVAGTVDFTTQQLFCARWSNLKEIFKEHYKLSDAAAPTGMRGMLNRLKIPLFGQHHLGMDDVSNLAKIAQTMISQGARMHPTGYAKNSRPPGSSVGRSVSKGCKGSFGKRAGHKGCSKGCRKGCYNGTGQGLPQDLGKGVGKSFSKCSEGVGKGGNVTANPCVSGSVPSALVGSGAQTVVRPPAPWARTQPTVSPGGVPPWRRPAYTASACELVGEADVFPQTRPEDPTAVAVAAVVDAAAAAADEAESRSFVRTGSASSSRSHLQAFLGGAPIPGEAWDDDDDEVYLGTGSFNPAPPKRRRIAPVSEAGFLTSTLSGGTSGHASSRSPAVEQGTALEAAGELPENAPSITDMLARLPRPRTQ